MYNIFVKNKLHAMLMCARRRRSRSSRTQKRPMGSEMEPTDQGENLPGIDVCLLYLFFLSARHLHFPAAVHLVLASSVGLFMLSMITGTSYATAVFFPQLAVVFLEIAWFCCFRVNFDRQLLCLSSPEKSLSTRNGDFYQVVPRRRTKSSEKAMTFSATTNQLECSKRHGYSFRQRFPGTVHPHMRHERGFLLQESTFSFFLRRAR